jgi:predicted transcriptional regulator
MRATTTLKLSEDLKARIARLAEETGRSTHGFMIDALERQVNREERWRDFINEAHAADQAIDEGAKVYSADHVHKWLDRLAQNPGAKRPKPWHE